MTDPREYHHSPSPDSISTEASIPLLGRLATPHPSAAVGAGESSNFYTHPSRISILNADGDLDLNTPARSPEGAREEHMDMEEEIQEALAQPWAAEHTGEATPSFSTAFDLFTSSNVSHAQGFEDETFVPSYLEGSVYHQRLQEAHRAGSLAMREARKPGLKERATNGSSSASSPLPPGSHRGMSHAIIERTPATGTNEDPSPLPTRWSRDASWRGIDIQADRLSVKLSAAKSHHDRDHEASAVRANHYVPRECGIYYFEVEIVGGKRDDTTIAVGFSTKKAALFRPIGWEPESWGYHGDDGRCFAAQNTGRLYGPTFNLGDVIGCGVNFKDNTAFFTKNGTKLGVAFHDIVANKQIYPTVSLKKAGEAVKVNFGQSRFSFNIDGFMKEHRDRVHKGIQAVDTSKLNPSLSESELVQTLVLQFLQHDGYVETARAFAEDIRNQKVALNTDPNVEVPGINIKDDEDANNRQRIRRAILDGDIDKAQKFTSVYYPEVLAVNREVRFKLQCRRFIEMVRKAAILQKGSDSKGPNGHAAGVPQDMDMDLNGGQGQVLDEAMDMDGSNPDQPVDPAEVQKLELEMIEYGQALQSEYADEPAGEITAALEQIWALVAYENPLKEPTVAHLLDMKGRVAVAEEVNSAILRSLGKSSRASLERIYAQTDLLLEHLRRQGGDSAFVSIRSVLGGIPSSS